MFANLKNLFTRRPSRKPHLDRSRRQSRRPLYLERLEERLSPAVDLQALVNGLIGQNEQQVGQLKILKDALDTIGSIRDIPVLGEPLGGLDGVENFWTDLESGLRRLPQVSELLTNHENLQFVLFSVLGPDGLLDQEGLDVLGDLNGDGQITAQDVYVTPFNEDSFNVDITIMIDHEIETSTDIGFGFGLPSLPFRLEGGLNGHIEVDARIVYDRLHFGLRNGSADRAAEFFFDTSRADELQITLDVSFSEGTSFDAQFGRLAVAVQDGTELGRTNFHGTFTMDVISAIGGGLTLTNHELNGEVAIRLNLLADLEAVAGFDLPAIRTDFDLTWFFNNSNFNGDLESFGTRPEAYFNNVEVNLGSVYNAVVQPFIGDLQDFIKPLEPVIDALNAPLPGISDLNKLVGGGDVSLLSLAESFLESTADTLRFFTVLVNLADSINDLNADAGSSEAWFGLGSFHLNGQNPDLRQIAPGVVYNPDGQPILLPTGNEFINVATLAARLDQLSNDQNSTVSQMARRSRAEDAGEVESTGSGVGIDLPFLTKPYTLLGLFLDQEVNLITFSGEQNIQWADRPDLINLGIVTIGLQGSIDLTGKFELGYDTRGLENFRDGFYVSADTNLSMIGGLAVSAGNSSPIHDLQFGGGIFTNDTGLRIFLRDPNQDGKIRLDELGLSPCLFASDGHLAAGAFLHAELGVSLPFVGFVGVSHTVLSPQVVLLNVTDHCLGNPFYDEDATPLASFDSSTGTLTLNMGSEQRRAARNIQTDEVDETFVVRHLSGSTGGERVEVSAFGIAQQFGGVRRIAAYAGDGNDVIDVHSGVLSAVELHGEDDDDRLSSGSPQTTLYGGQGNDRLTYLGEGFATLYGGAGDDHLQGGGGVNALYGEGDDDTLIGGNGVNTLAGGSGHDRLVAGPNGDTLDGGEGDDTLLAGAGNDILTPGSGRNLIAWEVGDGNTTVDNHFLGLDTVQIAGSDASDTFGISYRNGETLIEVASEGVSRIVSLTFVGSINIDGGLEADSFVVGDLRGSAVQMVNLNLSQVRAPDDAVDSIIVLGSTGDDVLTVEHERVWLTAEEAAASGTVPVTYAATDAPVLASATDAVSTEDLGSITIPSLDPVSTEDTVELPPISTLPLPPITDEPVVVLPPPVIVLPPPVIVLPDPTPPVIVLPPVETPEDQLPPRPIAGGVMKVTGLGNYVVRFANDNDDAVVSTGNGNDTVTVLSTTGPTTVRTEAGQDTLIVESSIANDLYGRLQLDGGADANTLTVRLSADAEAVEAELTQDAFRGSRILVEEFSDGTEQRTPQPFEIGYQAAGTFANGLTFATGDGGDTISVRGTRSGEITRIETGIGSDTLVGPDTSNRWDIGLLNSGSLNGSAVTFSGVDHFRGGSGDDTFVFPAGVSVSSIDGGGGVDTLDYSSSLAVRVNLTTGSATGVSGGVSNIENVIGGPGDDILVGNGAVNVLRGGDGRDLLIGGRTPDTASGDVLDGGAGEDILIAGATAYDGEPEDLDTVLSQWTRSDLGDYSARVDLLISNGGLLDFVARPGVFTSNGSLVNELTGQADARDLFFGSLARDTRTDRNVTNEVFVDPERRQFTVTVDATGLLTSWVYLDGRPYSRTAPVNQEFAVGRHTLSVSGGRSVTFEVDSAGRVTDPTGNLAGIATGIGTSSLTVTGHAITFDATGVLTSWLYVDGRPLSRSAPITVGLLPGRHSVNATAGATYSFDVSEDGVITDPTGTLAGVATGIGTSSLVLLGRQVTFDATAVLTSWLYVDGRPLSRSAPITVGLLPGRHHVNTTGGTIFAFDVSADGIISDPTGALSEVATGIGTSSLVIAGRQVTFDATALLTSWLYIDGRPLSPAAPVTVGLLPGRHSVNATAGATYSFDVSAEGIISDPTGALAGISSGLGTSTLTLTGRQVTFDATGLATSWLYIDGRPRNPSAPITVGLLPGRHSVHTTGGAIVTFDVSADGIISDPTGALAGISSGVGTSSLVLTGRRVTFDASALGTSWLYINGRAYNAAAVLTLNLLPGRHDLRTTGGTSITFDVSAAGVISDPTGALAGISSGVGTASLTLTGLAATFDFSRLGNVWVYLDGRAYSAASAFTQRLLPGRHELRLNGTTYQFDVDAAGLIRDVNNNLQSIATGFGTTSLRLI